jgi:hypothetical protein
MNNNRVSKIMLNCGPNGRSWLGRRSLKRLLDEAATGLSRTNSWCDGNDVCSPAGRNGIASRIRMTVTPCGLVYKYIRVHSSATLKSGPMLVTCLVYTQKSSGPNLRPPVETVPGDLSPRRLD